MRFVRANTEKQKVIEISEIPTLKKKPETALNTETNQPIIEREGTVANTAADHSEPEASTDIPKKLVFNNEVAPFPESVQDSVTVTTQEADDITDQALKAERDGTLSLLFGILIFAFLLLEIVVLILSFGQVELVILALIIAALFLASIVLSIVFGIKSLRSRYNTPTGRRRAIVGLVLVGIPFVYTLVSLLFGFF